MIKLEDYFDFQRPDDIRLKGTRVGIETILYEYIYRHRTAEAIADIYTNLTLEQIYATILYFLHNPEDVTQYMADWLQWSRKMREEQRKNPHSGVKRIMELKATQKQQLTHESSVSH